MKKIGLFLAAGLLSLGCVQMASTQNDHVTLTSKVTNAPAVNVRKANDASNEAKYVTSVTTQVEENGSNYNLRFSALVSAKYEDGKYYVPGDYGFHVEFEGSNGTYNQDYNVQYFYNSISATVGGVTTWYANEYSTIQGAQPLGSIPTIGSEVIGDNEYNVKLVISLTVEGVTDASREFTVRPYVDVEGAKVYGDHTKIVSINNPSGYYPVALDGKMDDSIWSQAVKDNRIEVRKGTTDATDLYVARDSKGVYIYGEYHVSATLNVGDGWWQRDNFEFRLVTTNDPNCYDNYQIWVTALNNGSHNATNGYVSPLVYNSATGMHEMTFEIFVQYNDYRIPGSNEHTPIGLHWGSAPASGWYCCAWWYNNDFNKTHWVSYYDETACEEHNYAPYETIIEQSCVQDGRQERECYVCSYVDVKINPQGAHNYTELVSETLATCISKGSQILGCAGCDDEITVELETVAGNHPRGATYANGTWSCCGTAVKNLSYYNQGGWGDVNTWSYLVKGLRGDFTVTTTLSLQTNDPNSGWWKGVLPIVQHELGAEAAAKQQYGSPWVTRMDWWGWCDEWQSSGKLTGQWEKADMDAGIWNDINRDMAWSNSSGANADDKFVSTMANCTMVWKCTRTGTTVLNEFTMTASDGNVYTHWTKSTDIALNKDLSLALAAEFANVTVTNVTVA